MKRILFVCTGNYYRSRFAEAVFNHGAEAAGLTWRAESRGLALVAEHDDLSPYTVEALMVRAIDRRHTAPGRLSLSLADLEGADRVVVLDREEHSPMMRQKFPSWAETVVYWDVADLHLREAADALAEIEINVGALIRELAE